MMPIRSLRSLRPQGPGEHRSISTKPRYSRYPLAPSHSHRTLALALALVPMVFAEAALSQEPLPSDGQVISRSEALLLKAGDLAPFVEYVMTDAEAQLLLDSPEALKEFVLDFHLSRDLAQRAAAQDLDKSPRAAARLAHARENILVEALMAVEAEAIENPDMAAIAQERYRANPKAYEITERRKAAHILLHPSRSCTECATIETIEERLANGEPFEALAAQLSDDSATAPTGGAINQWAAADGRTFVEAFEAALFALPEVGAVSPPIETTFGTHLIQLVAIEPARIPSYDEIEDALIASLVAEYRSRALSTFRAKSYPSLDSINLDPLRVLLQQRVTSKDVSDE